MRKIWCSESAFGHDAGQLKRRGEIPPERLFD